MCFVNEIFYTFLDSNNSYTTSEEITKLRKPVIEYFWNDITGKHQKRFLFYKKPGLKVQIPNKVTVLYSFKLFVTDDIINQNLTIINRNTNCYLKFH